MVYVTHEIYQELRWSSIHTRKKLHAEMENRPTFIYTFLFQILHWLNFSLPVPSSSWWFLSSKQNLVLSHTHNLAI